jgi:hypothetical protein|tara:strand:+ start:89 stop:526 length:438 start_codon:yes stop_codon:yes gene_type:complete
MGLDMYLRGEKFVSKYDHSQQAPEGGSLEVKRPVIDGFEVSEYILDMGYWRKFAPLHKYIVKVFANDVDECQPIHLTNLDCRRIAEALRHDNLPANEDCGGFFFGNPEFWDEDRANGEEHAKVFDKAAEWVESNSWNTVTYQASW